jgi:hypothetical protein
MSTPILPFAVWASGTNQNSIPANDNSLRNQILNGLVIDDATTAQPGSPTAGDIYIIPASATGAQWSTFDEDDLVIFANGTWYAFAPVEGVVVNFDGEQKQWTTVGGWEVVSGGGGGSVAAEDVTYDNASSGLAAADVQAAIDEIAGLSPGATIQCIPLACSDETTDLTTGTAKVTFRMPFAFTLLSGAAGVRASLTGAPSGSTLVVDINEGGSSILSTKLSIDASEKTSTTAATPAVISDTSLADDAEITIDIDQVGSSSAGKGLKVYLIGTKT